MMGKRHCCHSSMWSFSIRSVRFTTLFWNQSAFHLNGLFSSFESTGNTHHGFWFTPRGIQCKYPWWNLSAWCKYLRANTLAISQRGVNTFGISPFSVNTPVDFIRCKYPMECSVNTLVISPFGVNTLVISQRSVNTPAVFHWCKYLRHFTFRCKYLLHFTGSVNTFCWLHGIECHMAVSPL